MLKLAKHWRLIVSICCLFIAGNITPLNAQEPGLLSLESATLDLQTGQEYEITIQLNNISELWLANMEISYDPQHLYIIGTQSGSPVRQGTLFTEAGSSMLIMNYVESNTLAYTISMLAPSDPITGSGVVGVFRIYPLAAGQTQLFFSQAELLKVIYSDDTSAETENRIATGTEELPFTPILLQLNITGEQVEPPSEATATPTLSPTPVPQEEATRERATAEPTLVNVTAAPTQIPTESTTVDQGEAAGQSPLLLIAIVLLVGSGIGLFALWWMYRRGKSNQ